MKDCSIAMEVWPVGRHTTQLTSSSKWTVTQARDASLTGKGLVRCKRPILSLLVLPSCTVPELIQYGSYKSLLIEFIMLRLKNYSTYEKPIACTNVCNDTTNSIQLAISTAYNRMQRCVDVKNLGPKVIEGCNSDHTVGVS